MSKRLALALGLALAFAAPALAADPIEGNWVAATGNTVRITKCGDAFCMTAVSGPRKGKQIGSMSGANGKYSGSIVAEDDKTYSGTATLTSATTLRLRGCVAKIFCRSQTWRRA